MSTRLVLLLVYAMLGLNVQVQKIESKTEGVVIKGSAGSVITEGATGDNPRVAITGGSSNGNTAIGGATKDATKSNTENATEISPL